MKGSAVLKKRVNNNDVTRFFKALDIETEEKRNRVLKKGVTVETCGVKNKIRSTWEAATDATEIEGPDANLESNP